MICALYKNRLYAVLSKFLFCFFSLRCHEKSKMLVWIIMFYFLLNCTIFQYCRKQHVQTFIKLSMIKFLYRIFKRIQSTCFFTKNTSESYWLQLESSNIDPSLGVKFNSKMTLKPSLRVILEANLIPKLESIPLDCFD